MKNIIKITILSLVVVLFTGCLTTTTRFNQNEVDFKMKNNIKKVKNINVNVYSDYFDKTKHPQSFLGKARSMQITSTWNEKVLKSFMLSNFNNVNISNKKDSDIFINSKIKDFDYSNLVSGGIELIINNEISIYKNNNLIFKREYNSTIVETGKFFTTRTDINGFISELTTVSLFRFYDEIFKPDLIKALKENKE